MFANVSACKKIALKLYRYNWFERRRLLKSFSSVQVQQIKHELMLLKQINIENIDELVGQIEDTQNLTLGNKNQNNNKKESTLLDDCGFSKDLLIGIRHLLAESETRTMAPALVSSINEFSANYDQGEP